MNNHISESRTNMSSCKFPRLVYQCSIKNGNKYYVKNKLELISKMVTNIILTTN